jgi:hypothetical protein
MDSDKKSSVRGFKRDDGQPKNGNGDNLAYRIAGLEKAKMDPGMTPADVAAINRSINSLKEKLAIRETPKVQQEE